MNTLIRSWDILVFAVFVVALPQSLFAGTHRESATVESEIRSTLVWFQEQETGTASYPVRMIVNNQYLRIDDGEDVGDFVLFDRVGKTIFSVNRENQSVLVVVDKKFSIDTPDKLALSVQELDSMGSPDIDGRNVRVYRFYTNERLCVEVAAAMGLMEDVITVLRDFHRTLAAEHAVVAQNTPDEFRSDCDLSDLVFEPDRYLRYGFPVYQRDYNGKMRELRDFDSNYSADPRLFEVPVRYRRFSTEDLQG